MNLKTLTMTGIAVCFASGMAFAQEQPGDSPEVSAFTSENEQMMYEENSGMLAPFFTDETWTTLRSDEEVQSAFEAMGADDQAGMRAACERALEEEGSYGAVTVSLCQQVGAL